MPFTLSWNHAARVALAAPSVPGAAYCAWLCQADPHELRVLVAWRLRPSILLVEESVNITIAFHHIPASVQHILAQGLQIAE